MRRPPCLSRVEDDTEGLQRKNRNKRPQCRGGCVLDVAQPNALCMRISHSHNSSSSSMRDSMVVAGMVPSEFPRSFCVPSRAWPKLLRTFSSKPGREARCFLNGEATLLSASAVAVVDEDPSPAELPGAGVPETGDPDDESPAGAPRARGSAECCLFSYDDVS